MHKPINPGHPIVFSYGSPTERISVYIDAHLQSFVKSLPSHVQDTNNFLDMIRSLPTPLPPDTIWPLLMSPPYTPTSPIPMNSLPWNISWTNALPTTNHPLDSSSNSHTFYP